MKYKSILFFVLSLLILVFAVLFAVYKNNQIKTFEVLIEYPETPHFINDSIVNKLLTQNPFFTSGKLKDSLVLNEVEAVLEQHAVVENAEVYLKPSGILGIKITERKPFFLVEDTLKYFVDKKAKRFPFAPYYEQALPVFSGHLPEEKTPEVIQFLSRIEEEPFLTSELKALRYQNEKYEMTLRSFPFQVVLGSLQKIDHKIEKLKIFCAYQRAQDTLVGFKQINVQYANQVVALTPKER